MAVPCQNDFLAGLGAANELGQLRLRLADRDLPALLASECHWLNLDHLAVQLKPRPPYSHSSIFGYVNALIFQRNFFRLRVAIRTANRQKFLVLIFNRKSRDSDSTRFQRLSTTIGRFFASSITQRIARQRAKYRHH
jgi:hypothetical protein